jgi:hypothetical protein
MGSRLWLRNASKALGQNEPSPYQSSPFLSDPPTPSVNELGEPPMPVSPADRSLRLIDQLLTKSKQRKLAWNIGFEDGQFVTSLPNGGLAFVVQVKEDARKFKVLDETQETILEETILGRYVPGVLDGTPGSPTFQTYNENGRLRVSYSGNQVDGLFESIGQLQDLARAQALQVDDKLAKAEKLLAAI